VKIAHLSVAGLNTCRQQVIAVPRGAPITSTRFFASHDVFENDNMIMHLAKAEELILALTGAYRRGESMFQSVRAETHGPQYTYVPGYELGRIRARRMDYLPGVEGPDIRVIKKGSPRHLLFLFFATLTDRRTKSGGDFGVYASHCKIYHKHPELYTSSAISWNKGDLGKLLSRYKIGVPNQSAEYWIRCAETLFGNYGGNPVRLYEEHGSNVEGILKFKEAGKRLGKKNGDKESGDPLPGYGPKIASLYALFLDAFGALPFPEDAFPVDVQVQRLFIQYGAITMKTRVSNALMEKTIRPLVCLLAKFHGLDKQDISHAFWLLGSQGCTSCSRRLNAPTICPIYSKCLGCQNTANYFAKGLWDPADEPMKKGAATVTFGMLAERPTRYSRNPTKSTQMHLFTE